MSLGFPGIGGSGNPTTGTGSFTTVSVAKTMTPAGTTGAQTINTQEGSVRFAGAATSLVVTNSLCTVNSGVLVTVMTSDATMKGALAVPAAGSFTIFPSANPTGETGVFFHVSP